MNSTPRISSFGPDLRGVLLDDRYLLEDFAGCGGSGTVYAALDSKLRRRVAVKVIHPEYARTEEQRFRIRQEALVGAQISHANVAQILDFGEALDSRGELTPFIVMPLLRGRTLREFVLDGPVPWTSAALWMHQLLSGLAALHAHGVLHRDIKLGNCLLIRGSDREELKIIDLGLAKVTREDLLSRRPWSTVGRIIGTLPYISPEQALGEAVDERSDLYAAGVVLFELLTRRAPFIGSDYQVLAGHVGEPPPRPTELAPFAAIPAALEEVVLKALAKRPDDRYRSTSGFDAALAQVLGASGLDVNYHPMFAGCGEAQDSLAAWTCFEYERARTQADLAARMNHAWSPLKLLMELTPEE